MKFWNVIPTHFLDSSSLHSLGIFGDTKTLFEKFRLGTMFGIFFWTYRHLTLEFLSSLEVGNKNQVLRFRLMNEDRQVTLGQLAVIFCLPITDDHRPPPHIRINTLWTTFMEAEEVNTQHMSADHLHFSSVRYLQRFLGFTYFGRAEPHSCQ